MTVRVKQLKEQKKVKKTILEWLNQKIPRFGVWMAVLGSVLFAVSEACAKLIADDVSAEVIIAVRYTIHGFATVPFLIKAYKSLPKVNLSQWILAVLSGISSGATSYAANYSYHYIPLLDSFVLANSQPVFAAIIACLWLKEKLSFYDLGIILITLVGVVVACQPSFIFGDDETIEPAARTIGSLFGLLTALFMAITTTFTRKVKDTPSAMIIYMQGIGGVLIGFVGGLGMSQLRLYKCLTPTQIVALICAGFFGFLARANFTMSLQTEDATLVAVIQTMEIPFSFIAQLVILSHYPTTLSIIGATIVAVGTALLTGKKKVEKQAIKLKESFRSKIRPKVIQRQKDEEKEFLLASPETLDYDAAA